tara:strand:+ start:835 stop:1176 length:342 start_codon:yes stop_codon:yes gene_type:complete
LGATNTENTTQNRSHGGEPDKMTLCSYNIASQIFKVPRRKKTKKKQKKKGEEKTVTFFCFFHFSKERTRSRMEKQRKKKGKTKRELGEKKNRPHNLRVEQREDKGFRPTRAHI